VVTKKRNVRKITLKIFNKSLVKVVKICYHWAARLGKRAKNRKIKEKNVLHSRRPVGQELQKAHQARLISPRFFNSLFYPVPLKKQAGIFIN
jgi:hypothetical protein